MLNNIKNNMIVTHFQSKGTTKPVPFVFNTTQAYENMQPKANISKIKLKELAHV
jgi:hypothetical protein